MFLWGYSTSCFYLLLATAFECGGAFKVAKENLAFVFEFFADEAEAEKEAAECVLFIVDLFFFGGDSLLSLCHFAKGCKEMRVCIHLLLIGKWSKPREGNVLFGLYDGEFVSLEGFLDEVAFGCDKGFKVRKACFGELRCGKLNGDAVKVSLGGCRLGFGFRFGFNVALVNVETLVVNPTTASFPDAHA